MRDRGRRAAFDDRMGEWHALSLSSRSILTHGFSNTRIETLMAYAQSVFLLFASVYVCKETVEHVLLASGEGHHHHQGDEVADVFG